MRTIVPPTATLAAGEAERESVPVVPVPVLELEIMREQDAVLPVELSRTVTCEVTPPVAPVVNWNVFGYV